MWKHHSWFIFHFLWFRLTFFSVLIKEEDGKQKSKILEICKFLLRNQINGRLPPSGMNDSIFIMVSLVTFRRTFESSTLYVTKLSNVSGHTTEDKHFAVNYLIFWTSLYSSANVTLDKERWWNLSDRMMLTFQRDM